MLSQDDVYMRRFSLAISTFCGVLLFGVVLLGLFFLLLLLYKLEGWNIAWPVVFIPAYVAMLFMLMVVLPIFWTSLLRTEKRWWKHYGIKDYIPCFYGIGAWTFCFSLFLTWIMAVVFIVLLVLKLDGNTSITYQAIFWPPIAFLFAIAILCLIYCCGITSDNDNSPSKKEILEMHDEEGGGYSSSSSSHNRGRKQPELYSMKTVNT